MDYCLLTEDGDKSGDKAEDGEAMASGTTMTVAVMQESLCKSVWAYAVESKGATEEWLVQQVCEDIETLGFNNERMYLNPIKNRPLSTSSKRSRSRAKVSMAPHLTIRELAILTRMGPSRMRLGVLRA